MLIGAGIFGYRDVSLKLASAFSKAGAIAAVVFGRSPLKGETISSFSATYPLPFCREVARLLVEPLKTTRFDEDCIALKVSHGSAQWVSELCRSLKWKKLLQFRFRKANHINVNESLSFRSLVKHLSKDEPGSRFVALLDSKVVIGSTSKGRSSSKQLNFYLGSTLPYFIGGDLYPYLIHVGSKEYPSDDISRFVQLRISDGITPLWLQSLLDGDTRFFDQVVEADKLVWPMSAWSRLIRLLVIRQHSL